MSKQNNCKNNSTRLLCTVTSIEKFCLIKNRLNSNGIAYLEETVGNHKPGTFLTQLFLNSHATYGMHGEHDISYSAYVDNSVFEKAISLISDLL